MNRLQQEYMRLSKKLETKQPQHQVRKGNSARFGKCRMARWLEEDGKKVCGNHQGVFHLDGDV